MKKLFLFSYHFKLSSLFNLELGSVVLLELGMKNSKFLNGKLSSLIFNISSFIYSCFILWVGVEGLWR